MTGSLVGDMAAPPTRILIRSSIVRRGVPVEIRLMQLAECLVSGSLGFHEQAEWIKPLQRELYPSFGVKRRPPSPRRHGRRTPSPLPDESSRREYPDRLRAAAPARRPSPPPSPATGSA